MNERYRPRVLVIDDSAASRALLAEVLEDGGCDVVGRAMDGAMALRLVADLRPDAITCDLEMPGMDGFTFLRVVAKNFRTPVIMVTSNARPEAALQSLELGARDFVVKPRRLVGMRDIGIDIAAKIHAMTSTEFHMPVTDPAAAPPVIDVMQDVSLVVIGASTGGPGAVREVLSQKMPPLHPPILVAQHMPAGFTLAFAKRLAKATGQDVTEARDGEVLRRGAIRIAPGGQHLEVHAVGGKLQTSLEAPTGKERHVPSVDRLFESAAAAARNRVLGIVLTGMGRDGALGAKSLHLVGAPLWTESSATAIIFGMPSAAAKEHASSQRFRIEKIAENLCALFQGHKRA